MPRLTRFTCPKCERRYEVPPALAGLPLLCKGCGTALTVPDPPAEPEPEPEPPPPPKPKSKPAPPAARPKVPPPPKPAPDAEDDKPYPIPEPDRSPDIDFNLPVPAAANHGDTDQSAGVTSALGHAPAATRSFAAKPAVPQPIAAPAAGGRRLIAVVVDAAVGLILLAGSVFLGELLARKPTRQVWNDAGGAVSFPPVELMLWAAPPLLVVLVYALLLSRGATVGGWLRRRAA